MSYNAAASNVAVRDFFPPNLDFVTAESFVLFWRESPELTSRQIFFATLNRCSRQKAKPFKHTADRCKLFMTSSSNPYGLDGIMAVEGSLIIMLIWERGREELN
jgi:hypothetical protein